MKRKILGLTVSSVVLLETVAAQIGGGSTSFQGILPLISQILGIDVGNPYNLLGVVATFGILSLLNYIILKKAFDKMDMLDIVNVGGSSSVGGSEGGRNILAILSVLMTLSIVGTGAFMGIISGFRGLILLLFAFMLFGGIAILLSGGTMLGIGGIAWTSGKGAKAMSEGVKEGAEAFDGSIPHNMMNSVQSGMGSAWEDIKESKQEFYNEKYEGAINDVEEAEEIIEQLEKELKQGEDEISHELDEDIQRVRHMIEEESEEEEAVEDIHDRTERIGKVLNAWQEEIEEGRHNIHDPESYMNGGILTEPGKAGLPADYSLTDLEEDVNAILEKDLSVINEDISEEESELQKELSNLEGTLKASKQITEWIKQLKKFLEQIDEEGEEMEKLGQNRNFESLFQEAEEIEEEDAQLEDRIQYLQQELEEIEEKQEEAIELLEEHYQYGEQEIKNLKNDITLEGRVENVLGKIAGELGSSDQFQNMDGSQDVFRAFSEIESQIKEIEEVLQKEIDEKSQEESTVDRMANNFADMWQEVRNEAQSN